MHKKNFLIAFFALVICLETIAINAPSNLTATAKNQAAELSWDKITETNFSHYKLFYGTSSGNYSLAIELPSNTFTAMALQNGTTYFFAVKAIDKSGNESDYSNEVSAVPGEDTPIAPTNLTVKISGNSVELNWVHSKNEKFSHYKIIYGTNSSNLNQAKTTTENSLAFSDLKPNTVYYFSVITFSNDAKESIPSNQVSVLTPQTTIPPENGGNEEPPFNIALDFEWLLNLGMGIVLVIITIALLLFSLKKE